jgi:hypothetical protein
VIAHCVFILGWVHPREERGCHHRLAVSRRIRTAAVGRPALLAPAVRRAARSG